MKKIPFAILFALVFTLAVHADESVDANGTLPAGQATQQPEKQVQVAKSQSATSSKESALSGNEDSIDLDEVDDSADADKRPTVKFAAKPAGDSDATVPAPATETPQTDAAKPEKAATAAETANASNADAAPVPPPSPAVPAPVPGDSLLSF